MLELLLIIGGVLLVALAATQLMFRLLLDSREDNARGKNMSVWDWVLINRRFSLETLLLTCRRDNRGRFRSTCK